MKWILDMRELKLMSLDKIMAFDYVGECYFSGDTCLSIKE